MSMFASCLMFHPFELLLFLVLGVLSSLLAARKGYKWYLRIFVGLLGLIVLAFLPFANKKEQSPEEQQRLQSTGNTIGGVLSAISLGLWAMYHLLVK